jgi:hypothetical protein
MITRMWPGWTSPENAPAYRTLLVDEVFPGIERCEISRYLGISLLRRAVGNEVAFVTIGGSTPSPR